MPLLMELGGWEMDFCYKHVHVAPNGAPALQRRLFNRAKGRRDCDDEDDLVWVRTLFASGWGMSEVIFRHRRLSGIRGHETSETAAQLSEIAADRSAFWQFIEALCREPHQLDHDGYLRLMRDLGFHLRESKLFWPTPRAAPIAGVRCDIALTERLVSIRRQRSCWSSAHNPPGSANHRSLATILNSPKVQALFAHERDPSEPPR